MENGDLSGEGVGSCLWRRVVSRAREMVSAVTRHSDTALQAGHTEASSSQALESLLQAAGHAGRVGQSPVQAVLLGRAGTQLGWPGHSSGRQPVPVLEGAEHEAHTASGASGLELAQGPFCGLLLAKASPRAA